MQRGTMRDAGEAATESVESRAQLRTMRAASQAGALRWVVSKTLVREHGMHNDAADQRRQERHPEMKPVARRAGRPLTTLRTGLRRATPRSVKFLRWLLSDPGSKISRKPTPSARAVQARNAWSKRGAALQHSFRPLNAGGDSAARCPYPFQRDGCFGVRVKLRATTERSQGRLAPCVTADSLISFSP